MELGVESVESGGAPHDANEVGGGRAGAYSDVAID
jgi:hypothetical protein